MPIKRCAVCKSSKLAPVIDHCTYCEKYLCPDCMVWKDDEFLGNVPYCPDCALYLEEVPDADL